MIDWNQNSNKPYLKIRYQGNEHTFALPLPKKVPGWENMTPEEFDEKQGQLIKLTEEIEKAVMTALNENLSEEEFISQLLLIFRRLTRILLNTPIALFAVKWAFEQALRNKPSPDRVWHVCNAIRRFLNFLGNGRNQPLSSLKSRHFKKHVRQMRIKNAYAPSAMNNQVVILRSFAKAVDPTGRLGKDLEEEAVVYFTREPLTLPQLRRIMRFLKRLGAEGEEWRTLILILLYTPIRPKAASQLKLENIDFRNPGAESISCKDKGKIVTVGIPTLLLDRLKELRKKIRENGEETWLMPTLRKSPETLNGKFGRILRANGISVEHVDPKYGRKQRFEHCLYDLRHRYSNWVFGLTQSKQATKDITNHDTDKAMNHYLNSKDPFVLEQQRKILDLAPSVV